MYYANVYTSTFVVKMHIAEHLLSIKTIAVF